ncbi:hypothetical protein M758_UG125100 [Ceratodon purpureus]|nr:hypothetical protein M758_UG125100 [Ceratodon purpureus]
MSLGMVSILSLGCSFNVGCGFVAACGVDACLRGGFNSCGCVGLSCADLVVVGLGRASNCSASCCLSRRRW